MGNRANVVFVRGGDHERISPTVYLHWNGGPESVYAFLEALNDRGVRADAEYDCARFIQTVGEFFDQRERLSCNSLGVIAPPTAINAKALGEVPTDNSDNGFYVVDRSVPLSEGVRRFTFTYLPPSSPLGEWGFDGTEWTREEVESEYWRSVFSAAYKGMLEYLRNELYAGYQNDMEYRRTGGVR